MMSSPVPNRPEPELLAPAGDFDAMRAAVANGANAVYFGLTNYNARHRAANFTLEELPRTMEYLHSHNVRGYVTFNTLIFSDELPDAVRFIQAINDAGADAVIVQDLGLVRLIRAVAPGLPVHGSTQMTLTEPRGIDFVTQLGCERVILARELSLPEIQRITQSTTTPVEVFVHGALCVAYSGQCLTSESLGGRSANRGQCAQACRLPYELIVDGIPRDLGDKAYLLSPQDLAAYDLIDDLVQLKVCSFKIEGRLKSAHYVAATTQTYRSALDAALSHAPFRITPEQQRDLAQSFSRGFTHGFLSGVNHQTLVPARFPKSRGLRIGTVARITRTSVIVQLDPQLRTTQTSLRTVLKPGDGVVFDEGHPEQDEQGGRLFEVRPAGKGQFEITFARGQVNLKAIAPNAIVWKTDDPAVRKRLEQTFSRDTVVHRQPIRAAVEAHIGSPLKITFTTQNSSVEVTWEKPLERAQKFPVSVEVLRDQLGRLGDTPYELTDVELHGEGAMVPKSVLNDLRRQAIERLMQPATRPGCNPGALVDFRAAIREAEHRRAADATAGDASFLSEGRAAQPNLYILARTLDQLQAVLDWTVDATLIRPSMVYCDFEDIRRYKDAVALANSHGMPIALATLRIVKPHEEGTLNQIAQNGPDAVLVRNLAAVSFYREKFPALPQIGDYSLNIANELTADLFRSMNLVRMVPSYDLNWRQLRAMLSQINPSIFETVIHQHMPMFHMEHCVFAATLSNGKDYRDCGRPCEKHQVDLQDRVGQPHPLIPDVGCRNTLYNAQPQSAAEFLPEMKELGLQHYRIELLRESAEEIAPLLDHYARALLGHQPPRTLVRSLNVLNQLGVTRGTLDRE